MGILDVLKGSGSSPPPSLTEPKKAPRAPIFFAYTERREPHAGPTLLTAPDSIYDAYLPLDIGWQEAPDPIRQSDFWADGNKVNAQARMLTPSHLAIGAKEAVMQDSFKAGKLVGYLAVRQYAGAQAPLTPRANIQEPVPITYGSQYEVTGIPQRQAVVLASGMAYDPSGNMDGYPY